MDRGHEDSEEEDKEHEIRFQTDRVQETGQGAEDREYRGTRKGGQ